MEILDYVLDSGIIQLAASIFRHLKNGGKKRKLFIDQNNKQANNISH